MKTPPELFRLIGLLFIILICHAGGLYVFTRGFLLTRLVLDTTSTCEDIPIPGHSFNGKNNDCWLPRSFSKAVVIMVDALRYDFVTPQNSTLVYHNVFTALSEPHPGQSLLFKFIADPPTTTLQRLKGLTTGSLPTFIDAGSNFAGTQILEDNLIHQLYSNGRRIAFMGDDTWTSLFPTSFEPDLTFPYESLNVLDLYTVDNGVKSHLFPLLQNQTGWDVLIGHFLGVDHAGHRYGPSHSEMKVKLKEMDTMVRDVMELIDDDTLLLVMGDHGMDEKGDHGGDSPDEVESALWMYSKKRHIFKNKNTTERSVFQIDLVPTLALLLGVPIPYNNLGFPIAEAFGDKYPRASSLTAAQILRYRKDYSEHGSDLGHLDSLPDISDLVGNVDAAYNFYQENLTLCHKHWARFDPYKIVAGCLILLVSTIFLGFKAKSSLAALVFPVVHAILFASNSYTVWEDKSIQFLFATVVLILLYPAFRYNYVQVPQYLMIIILSRLASAIHVCREEQMPYCKTTFYSLQWLYVAICVFGALSIPALAKRFLQRADSYVGAASIWVGVCFRIALFLVAMHKVLDLVGNEHIWGYGDSELQNAKVIIARIVIGMALVAGNLAWSWGPLCVTIDTIKTRNDGSKRPAQVLIIGVMNIYGSLFFLLFLCWFIVLYMLQKPAGEVSLILLFWQILLAVDISSSGGDQNLLTVLLCLLSYMHFFSTGHQAVLSSIQWDSAFLLFSSPVYLVSPMIIIMNSFPSFILTTISLPLFAIWRQDASEGKTLDRLASIFKQYVLYHSIVTLSAVIWAAYFRRHLMVWKIFAPRFMMGALVLLVVEFFALVSLGWGFKMTLRNTIEISSRLNRLIERQSSAHS